METYWVVQVRDPADTVLGARGYTRRFDFRGERAALEAWSCWARAMRFGFEATAEIVYERPARVIAP